MHLASKTGPTRFRYSRLAVPHLCWALCAVLATVAALADLHLSDCHITQEHICRHCRSLRDKEYGNELLQPI